MNDKAREEDLGNPQQRRRSFLWLFDQPQRMALTGGYGSGGMLPYRQNAYPVSAKGLQPLIFASLGAPPWPFMEK
jgi:hypothetical protein